MLRTKTLVNKHSIDINPRIQGKEHPAVQYRRAHCRKERRDRRSQGGVSSNEGF